MNFPTDLCPELWPALRSILDPSALSSFITVLRQVVFGRPSLYFLFPVGVHASYGYFKYPFVRHPYRDIAKPSEPALLIISRDVFHTVRLLIQFLISHLVGPSQ